MYVPGIKIKDLLDISAIGKKVVVMGWVRTFRSNRFIALNDGSCLASLQIVTDNAKCCADTVKRITVGASLKIEGIIIHSQGKGQITELQAETLEILGDSDPEQYPLQPKKHSFEFLREVAHLRIRTNTFGAIFRVRSALAFAIHRFFNENGFVYLHTPIITASDAEGAGEMFRVTTLDLQNLPKDENGSIHFQKDFFGKPAHLTVSGQLEGELGAMGLGAIYTFGPTFRAENSNTTRHLAEFWMIEPEMAFYDAQDNTKLAIALLKYCIQYVLEHCTADIQFLTERLLTEEKQKPERERNQHTLEEKLRFCTEQTFEQISYTEAIAILQASEYYKKNRFFYPITWGTDLQSEHERYLVEKHFKKPVVLTDYPKAVKAFYMRQNDDGKTVAAMDILFPGIGEIIGGSQREERLELLQTRMQELQLPTQELNWYLDTRRFGTCVHSGFGLGFERLVLFVTGMTNIRDVIPFPRTPNNISF